jgi:hypothetical protein
LQGNESLDAQTIDHNPFSNDSVRSLHMHKSIKFSGVAVAAAILFGAAPLATVSAADAAKVKCEGVNGCKGQSACKTASNSCQGQNSCKGKGYLQLSKADCDAAMAKMKSEKK